MKKEKKWSRSKIIVSADLAEHISHLREYLVQHFGEDYSYTIMGKGEIVAVDNKKRRVYAASKR